MSWSFVFRAYMGAVASYIQDAMLAAETLATEIKMSDVNETRQGQVRELYHILAILLKDRAQRIMMRAPVGNGFEVWRKLKETFEPAAAGRQLGLLQAILSPDLEAATSWTSSSFMRIW